MYMRPPSQILKDSIKGVASPMLDALGMFDRWIDQVRASSSVWTILMYHRVIDRPADDPFGLGMCVRLRRFEEQVAYLSRNFHLVSVREAAARLERGDSLPPGSLSVTFDDGYLDNLTLAQPVLERHGVPWTLFVATGGLPEGQAFWWDRVIRAFAATEATHFDPDALGEPLGLPTLPLDGSERKAALEAVLTALWDLPIEQAMILVGAIEQQLVPNLPADRGPQAPRANWAQLRELCARGVEIGAHTVRHPNLNLLSPAAAAAEMQRSRQVLEDALQAPVAGFAYPGGRMSRSVVEIARQCGFAYSLSTVSCLNHLPCDLFALGRVGMPDAGVADFKRSLHGIAHRSAQRPVLTQPAPL